MSPVLESPIIVLTPSSMEEPPSCPTPSPAEVVVDEDRDARVARRVAVRYMRDSGGLVRVEDEDGEPVADEASLPTA
jgi:hypothetical protein